MLPPDFPTELVDIVERARKNQLPPGTFHLPLGARTFSTPDVNRLVRESYCRTLERNQPSLWKGFQDALQAIQYALDHPQEPPATLTTPQRTRQTGKAITTTLD